MDPRDEPHVFRQRIQGVAQYLTPSLTSIRQPIALIAETATEALLNSIRNPKTPPRSIQLDVELVTRASTQPN